MKHKIRTASRGYQAALQTYLRQGKHAGLEAARGLGSQALVAGLQTLDLARLHEQTLIKEVLPGCSPSRRNALIKEAGTFFAAAITPTDGAPRSAGEAAITLKRFIETLSQRTVELAASNLELSLEITQRKAVEKALKKSEHHYSELLKRSDRLQEQLRRLSRQVLSAQEEERKMISRELHDVIVQTLTGINVRLANLKKEAASNTKGLDQNIARTQRLVEKSVNIVHQFARELRPAVLDDLGLIPALHSFMKGFSMRTGVRVRLTAFAGVESLDTARRTVLYRVAQEALTNIGRHAKATHARVTIQSLDDAICMKIMDDGRGFHAEGVLHGKRHKRLGLLGMKERVEMVGGSFAVRSSPRKGAMVEARMPFPKIVSKGKRTKRTRKSRNGKPESL